VCTFYFNQVTLEMHEIQQVISASGKRVFNAVITLTVSGYFGIKITCTLTVNISGVYTEV